MSSPLVPTNTRLINTLTSLSANAANANWAYIPPSPTVNAAFNPGFNRQVVLSLQGVLFTRGGCSTGILLSDLCILVAKANPSFTWPPVIATQPVNTVVSGTAATSFTIAATDEVGGDISYQWIYAGNSANVAATGPFSNVTTATLNISNVQAANASTQLFICTATNPSGSNQSTSAGTADITAQPSNASVTHPTGANFSVTVVSGLGVQYQWCANGANITSTGTAAYSGWTSNILTVGVSNGLNSTNYLCQVTVLGATANSSNAVLTVA